MTRHFHIHHRTAYRFSRPAEYSIHQAHLRPAADERQSLLEWNVAAGPATSHVHAVDGHGNRCEIFTTRRLHDGFVVTAEGAVSVEAPPPVGELLAPSDERAELGRTAVVIATAGYAVPTPLTQVSPELAAWFAPAAATRRSGVWPAALDLLGRVHEALAYAPGATHATTTAAEAFALRRGVCQDFTHVFLAAARALGMPARYVSGYVEPGAGAFAAATHAWAEVYVPGHGWRGFDPTAGAIVGDGHVKLAVGRDYQDVAPVKGFRHGGGGSELVVEVTVRPLFAGGEAAAEAVQQ